MPCCCYRMVDLVSLSPSRLGFSNKRLKALLQSQTHWKHSVEKFEVPFMRIVSLVLMLAATISSSAYAAPTACELISAADMSAVLGRAVTAVADNRGGQTK